MEDSTTIELASGTHTITVNDLEQIKVELLRALRNKQPAVDYFYLVEELENSAAAMFLDNDRPRVGQWAMVVCNGQALMERQQFPRAPLMRFYNAALSIQEGTWKIDSISIKKVWAAR